MSIFDKMISNMYGLNKLDFSDNKESKEKIITWKNDSLKKIKNQIEQKEKILEEHRCLLEKLEELVHKIKSENVKEVELKDNECILDYLPNYIVIYDINDIILTVNKDFLSYLKKYNIDINKLDNILEISKESNFMNKEFVEVDNKKIEYFGNFISKINGDKFLCTCNPLKNKNGEVTSFIRVYTKIVKDKCCEQTNTCFVKDGVCEVCNGNILNQIST